MSAIYLYASAIFQQRTLLPFWHDELWYRLQTQMLAHGRLWMPAHPLGEFFESYFVITQPVYAALYFPGTALLHVPGIWLGLPYFVIPLAIAAASAALLYRVIAELLDGAAGLLAVLLLLSLQTFRWIAFAEMSHAALFWVLVIAWAWLGWRRSMCAQTRGWADVVWAAVAGAGAGWLAITRPVDALCAFAPLATAWGLDLYRHRNRRQAMVMMAVAVFAAAPFVILQLAFNYGVTGHVLQTPLDWYNRRMFQQQSVGFRAPRPDFWPPTRIPQLLAFYQFFILPQLRSHTPANVMRQLFSARLSLAAWATLPSLLAVILIPLGLGHLLASGAQARPRRALWLMLPIYMLAMTLYVSFFAHYCIPLIPAVFLMLLSVIAALHRAWPGGIARTIGVLFLIGLSLAAFPEINGRPTESSSSWKIMEMNYAGIPAAIQAPAIVLFRFGSPRTFHEEPVYNTEVAWPDDATIVRAHDLGAVENRRLFQYYAARQPQRNVYTFDRDTMALRYLGRVSELAARPLR